MTAGTARNDVMAVIEHRYMLCDPKHGLRGTVHVDLPRKELTIEVKAKKHVSDDIGYQLVRGTKKDGEPSYTIYAQIAERKHGRGFTLRLYRKDSNWNAWNDPQDPHQVILQIPASAPTVHSDGETVEWPGFKLSPARFLGIVSMSISFRIMLPGQVLDLRAVRDRQLVHVGESLDTHQILGVVPEDLRRAMALIPGIQPADYRRCLLNRVRQFLDGDDVGLFCPVEKGMQTMTG